MVVISFHSLEDRIVKQFIAPKQSRDEVDRRAPFAPTPQPMKLKLARPREASPSRGRRQPARALARSCAWPRAGRAAVDERG